MNVKAPKMKTLTKTSPTQTFQPQQLESVYFDHLKQCDFLQGVIEGLLDGILILTETGELVHANASAYRIFRQLHKSANVNFIPPAIWQVCQSLIESRSLFPDQLITLFDDIVLDKSITFRIRVRWLDLYQFDYPCLLVTIEDRYESVKNVASAEAKKYGMTAREKQVWSLYRANYSYKEIAAELYITLNTVKKHMKNIHAKRQAAFLGNDKE